VEHSWLLNKRRKAKCVFACYWYPFDGKTRILLYAQGQIKAILHWFQYIEAELNMIVDMSFYIHMHG